MIALIENTCVEKKQWIAHDEMMNITVVAESTPGPIAINCATYVGYKQKGFAGALIATIGMILPSFCIIFAISKFCKIFCMTDEFAYAGLPKHVQFIRHSDLSDGPACFDEIIRK